MRQIDIDEWSIAQVVSLAHDHLADLGQQLLSAVTLRIRWAVHQRKARRSPGKGNHEVITGSFGNSQGILDLAHCGIVGPRHATRYCRGIDVGDNRGVRHGVGAAGHGQSVPLVVPPSGATQPITGPSARREAHADAAVPDIIRVPWDMGVSRPRSNDLRGGTVFGVAFCGGVR
jgi:hypothetical protein